MPSGRVERHVNEIDRTSRATDVVAQLWNAVTDFPSSTTHKGTFTSR